MTDYDGDGGASKTPEKPNRIDFKRISLLVRNRLERGFLLNPKNSPASLTQSILATSLVYFILSLTIYNTSLNLCNRWGENLKYYSKIESGGIFVIRQSPAEPLKNTHYDPDKYLKDATFDDLKKDRIKSQIYTIRNRAITTLRVARDMYYWLTIFTILTCMATVIAGVAASALIRKGWDGVGDVTKGVFLTSVLISVFAASFAAVFQLKENAEMYLALYQNYVNLEEYLFTALALQGLPDSPPAPNDPQPQSTSTYPGDLIYKIDKALETYSLTFKLNAKSIPNLSEVINTAGMNDSQ